MFRVSVRPPLPTPTMWRGFWAGPRVLVERDREAVLAGSELGVLVGTISKSLTNWPMSLRILVVGVVAVHEVGTTPGPEVARIVTRRTGALTGSSTWAGRTPTRRRVCRCWRMVQVRGGPSTGYTP